MVFLGEGCRRDKGHHRRRACHRSGGAGGSLTWGKAARGRRSRATACRAKVAGPVGAGRPHLRQTSSRSARFPTCWQGGQPWYNHPDYKAGRGVGRRVGDRVAGGPRRERESRAAPGPAGPGWLRRRRKAAVDFLCLFALTTRPERSWTAYLRRRARRANKEGTATRTTVSTGKRVGSVGGRTRTTKATDGGRLPLAGGRTEPTPDPVLPGPFRLAASEAASRSRHQRTTRCPHLNERPPSRRFRQAARPGRVRQALPHPHGPRLRSLARVSEDGGYNPESWPRK